MYSNCPLLPFCVIMSTRDVREEALINIRCIVKGYHLCRFEVNAGEVLTANKNRRRRKNAEMRLKLLTIVVTSATYSPSLWIPFWPHCSPVNIQSIKMKCVYNHCVQRCDFFCTDSICNQSISIYLSTVIDNPYQSISTQIFATIFNINRLIDIDWYWLTSIVIDYRFHQYPGVFTTKAKVMTMFDPRETCPDTYPLCHWSEIFHKYRAKNNICIR